MLKNFEIKFLSGMSRDRETDKCSKG